MSRLILSLILPAFLLLTTLSFGQKRVEHVLHSKVFEGDRKITVCLPKGYEDENLYKFPVAYLFDGQFEPYLTMVSGITDYYSQSGFELEMIIVSVPSENRFAEFIPEPKADSLTPTAYSTKLTTFLAEELFPFIDSAYSYRTTPLKIGIGHSLGATFLLNEAFRENSPFGAIIAASPNTTVPGMATMIPAFIETHPETTTFLFVTTGDADETEKMFLPTTLRIDSALSAQKSKSLDWNFRKYDGATHVGTFPRTFNDGYLLLSARWNISPDDLARFKGLEGAPLEEEIRKCFKRKSILRKSEMLYSRRGLLSLQTIAAYAGDYATAYNINTLSLLELEKDTINAQNKKVIKEDLMAKHGLYNFQAICANAREAFERKEYKLAADEYMRAFRTGVIVGTFVQRIDALDALVLAGNKEEAFRQIELLANTFGLQGSWTLTENPVLMPLHNDRRWSKYVKILDENLKETN